MKIEGHSCRDKKQWIEHDLFSEYWLFCYDPDTTSIRENILRICWYRHLLTMTSWSFINLRWVFPLNHGWLPRGIIDQGVSRRMCLALWEFKHTLINRMMSWSLSGRQTSHQLFNKSVSEAPGASVTRKPAMTSCLHALSLSWRISDLVVRKWN